MVEMKLGTIEDTPPSPVFTTEFQALEKTKKQKRILKLYAKGMSIRQISRLTGETKGMVEKWLK